MRLTSAAASYLCLVALLTFPWPLPSPLQAAEAKLRIGGTGAAVATMTHLAGVFNASQDAVTVEVLPSLGSSGGIRALAEGAIDIAVSARPLKPAEAEKSLAALPLLRTPFVFVSSRREAQEIAAGQLAQYYGDPQPRWADGSLLRVILRPESDSDRAFLRDRFPGMAAALTKAQARPEVPVATTDQDNLRMAGEAAGTLTTATLLQVTSEFADLVVLPLDGIAPTVANMQDGSYPYYKEFYAVRRTASEPAVERFLQFLSSDAGRRILVESGSQPLL